MVLTKSNLLQIKEPLKIDELNKSILALRTTFTSSVNNPESSITTGVSFLEASINDKLSILETKVDANIQSLLKLIFERKFKALNICHHITSNGIMPVPLKLENPELLPKINTFLSNHLA